MMEGRKEGRKLQEGRGSGDRRSARNVRSWGGMEGCGRYHGVARKCKTIKRREQSRAEQRSIHCLHANDALMVWRGAMEWNKGKAYRQGVMRAKGRVQDHPGVR